MKKRDIILFILIASFFILVASVILFLNNGNVLASRSVDRFASKVERGHLDDVRLVIYYMDPTTLTRGPVDVNLLTSG